MNKIQKNYITAKAAYEAAREIQKEKYNQFLDTKGLTELADSDIDVLDAEYGVFAKTEIEETGAAYDVYKAAENDLVEFGLAIAPAKIRETLKNAVNLYYTKRQEMIDLLVRLDTNTLPAALKI